MLSGNTYPTYTLQHKLFVDSLKSNKNPEKKLYPYIRLLRKPSYTKSPVVTRKQYGQAEKKLHPSVKKLIKDNCETLSKLPILKDSNGDCIENNNEDTPLEPSGNVAAVTTLKQTEAVKQPDNKQKPEKMSEEHIALCKNDLFVNNSRMPIMIDIIVTKCKPKIVCNQSEQRDKPGHVKYTITASKQNKQNDISKNASLRYYNQNYNVSNCSSSPELTPRSLVKQDQQKRCYARKKYTNDTLPLTVKSLILQPQYTQTAQPNKMEKNNTITDNKSCTCKIDSESNGTVNNMLSEQNEGKYVLREFYHCANTYTSSSESQNSLCYMCNDSECSCYDKLLIKF